MSLSAFLSLFPNSSSVNRPAQTPKPAPGQVVQLDLATADAEQLLALARASGANIVVTSSGALAIRFPDDAMLVLGWTAAELNEATGFARAPRIELAQQINRDIARDTSGPASGPDHELADGVPGLPATSHLQSLVLQPPTQGGGLSGLGDETRRWGRDDLKRGEMGSAGQTVNVQVGAGLDHMIGQGDEDPGRRNGEKPASSDNRRFPGETLGVGSSIDHLWLLGDFEYHRSSGDLPEDADGPLGPTSNRQATPPPLTSGYAHYDGVEDTNLTGRIFDPSIAGVPVVDRQIEVDPALGTVTLNLDGTFEFIPTPGYSGPAEIEFRITDPRTGRVETGILDVMVRAVVDTPSITAGTTTLEDTTIAMPVTVALNDPDGSETIDQVVLSGIPVGAVLGWNAGLPGSVAAQPDGSYLVTGSTAEIQALLQSLTLIPPDDFSGPIPLSVSAVVTERNLDPAIPGYLSTTTIDFPFVVQVVADADVPDVTGDERTTDEDTPVALPDLAAALNDLDGSEILTIEIRNVPAGAAFDVGHADPLRPGVWLFTPAEIAGNPVFTPPANFVGDITMQIAAIATEQSNSDQEIVLAPVIVHVIAINGPDVTTTAEATNEDTAVRIGDNIAIVIDDPLGSEELARVDITGFPAGSVVTYTDAFSVPQIVTILVDGAGITITGATEADIRLALSTVQVLPPPHQDGDLNLSVTAHTLDISSATFTDTRPLVVAVHAVADTPIGSGAGIGNEDSFIPVPISLALVDADGSESFDFVDISGVPAGATVQWTSTAATVTVLPDGTLRVTGSVADIQSRLASLAIRPPVDSDTNFSLSVTAQTRESNPSEPGDVAVPTASLSFIVPVTVNPVPDAPLVTGTSSVNEDGLFNPADPGLSAPVAFGANVVISATDATDASERITAIEVSGLPVGAIVTYTPVAGGATVTHPVTALSTSILLSGGSEAEIRAALASMTLLPPLHSDADITLAIAVTKTDATATEGEAAVSQTFFGSHSIVVSAVADLPTLVTNSIGIGGSGFGLEDNDIPLSLTVGHPDTDGTERIFEVLIRNVPSGFVLNESSAGVGTLTYDAGRSAWVVSGPSDVAVNDVLNNLTLALSPAVGGARQHLDTDFALDVEVTSRETSPTNDAPGGAEVALLDRSQTFTVNIPVNAVADGVTNTGVSSLSEDTAGVVGSDIVLTKIDTDGTESITRVEVSSFPVGATVSYTAVDSTVVSVVVPAGGYTAVFTGGTEAQIRAALDTLSIQPPLHSDVDFNLSLAVTTLDNDGSNIVNVLSQAVTVAAVADLPTLVTNSIGIGGSGFGLEDNDIPLSLTVGHPDTDGTERIFEVLIRNVPSGFVLNESSAGVGTLTYDAGRSAWVVSGPSDVAVNDVLNNLTLALSPAVGGARQHLDTDFALDVEVTSRETSPTNDAPGGAEVALLDRSQTFTVNIPVNAVADGVNPSGASTIVEDRANAIGTDITWTKIDTDGTENVTRVEVSSFPVGATVSYTAVDSTVVSVVVPVGGYTAVFTGGTEAQIRAALDTLAVQAPLNSDGNFSLGVAITTTDNDASSIVDLYAHAVVVQAVADTPSVAANAIVTDEDTGTVLSISPGRSADSDPADNSETLSLRITIPVVGGSPVGTLTATPVAGVTLTDHGGGIYSVTAAGADPVIREALLDSFVAGNLSFVPRAQWSGVLTGVNGIRVDAISTEAAVGGELAPLGAEGAPNGTDGPTATETVTTYFDVSVNPIVDPPVLANASTILRENNNSISPADPNLTLSLGSRLGLTTVDTDGSQGLSVTLSNLPTNLQSASFATTLAGVTTSISLATGTITVSSLNASDALAVLQSLSVVLADDRDENFTVAVDGTMTDTNGASNASAAFSLSHNVVVRAVADEPAVSVGAATKPAVDEDSGFVTYPVTVALNDTDGSETMQSVTVQVSTPGTGAIPVMQFGTTTGVTFDTSVAGRVVLTGTTTDIAAAMTSLQIRPGVDNGEDITVTVTAVAVESNPSEDNNGAAAGMGGGVAGAEISTPTAPTIASFLIPVTPVPEVPTLIAPATATGLEDTRNAIAGISISGVPDPDGSEARYLEIDTTSFPAGTTFTAGGVAVGSVVSGWVRIPEAALATLEIQPPLHFTGTMALTLRITVVDTTSTDTVTTPLPTQTLTLTVNPIADAVTPPSDSLGYEDAIVAFGADVASTVSGIRIIDTVVGSATPGGAETLSSVVLTVPADTSALTYTLSGTYVPAAAGPIAGVGSSQVQYNAALRVYTITSTIITGAADVAALSDSDRAQAEADIRATLQTFQVALGQDRDTNGIDDGQQDRNGAIQVAATTLDVKNGVADTETTTFSHDVVILARADTPSIVAGFAVTGAESGSATNIIALEGPGAVHVVANRSIDTDGVSDSAGWGTERLSVEVTGLPAGASITTVSGYSMPVGGTLSVSGGNRWTVNAANENDLNDILAHLGLVSPYYSGPATLTFTAITTEQGQAGDPSGGIDVLQATALATVNVTITPTVDTPVVKANAVGIEDTVIPIPNAVTLGDPDGSETYTFRILATSVPAGSVIYGTGNVIIPELGGYYTLTAAEVAGLAIRPPLHFSTINPATPDIVLQTETIVTDGAAGPVTFANSIAVSVQGVADTPSSYPVSVAANEDEPYPIGAAIVTAAGGSVANALVDADGSETLSFVLAGLPTGVIPQATAGTIAYLGGGRWSVSADAVPTLTLPPVLDYSGNSPYPTLTLTAVSQEIEGDQATSAPWPLTITVSPVIDAATVDGLASWSPGTSLTETQVETSGVSLASAASHAYADTDGSEIVLRYVFDLSGLITDAGIAGRLAELPGAGSGLDKLVAGYISGNFDYYPTGATIMVNGQPLTVPAGSIVVLPADVAGVSLDNDLFLDSNVDFSIPVAALLEDNANGPQKLETTTLPVSIQGIADVPTVFANNPDNDANPADIDTFAPLSPIPLSFGGVTTDIDADRLGVPAADGLGRPESETVYYILRLAGTTGGSAPEFALVNSLTSTPIGLDNGDGTFLVRPSELTNLALITAQFTGAPVTMNFEVTSVAVDDGSLATSATNGAFSLTVDPGAGGSAGTPPPVPSVVVANLLGGTEDVSGALANPAQPVVSSDPGVLSTAVMLSVPVGATVTGATFNPVTSRWVASAADFNAGLVRVQPPSDFSGSMPITIEAVATGSNLVRSSTGEIAVTVYIDPVADGPAVAAAPAAGTEDLAFALNAAVSERDVDGSETIDAVTYVRLSDGATLVGAFATVGPGDADATIDGQSLVGFYRVPTAGLGTLQARGATNWHGTISIEIAAVSRDPGAPPDPTPDADNVSLSMSTFTAAIVADADAPTVPLSIPTVTGQEDASGGIALTGLSAALNDFVTANGAEVLSAVISGAPAGTRFSAGANNGDGSWTIPVSALATLGVIPPLDFAGTMALTLTAIALELSNGDEAQSSRSFSVIVTPAADSVEILTPDVVLSASGLASLPMNVRMQDDTGSGAGEMQPELIEVTFTGMPTGAFLVASLGGTLREPVAGTWVFVGTEAQSNALQVASGPSVAAGTHTVQISAVTIDGTDRLASPVLDSFQLTISTPTTAGTQQTGTGVANTLVGGNGNDILSGLGGNDTLSGGSGLDRLTGGQGADAMTGGGGRDLFSWGSGDMTGGPDSISDFSAGLGGDALDVSALLTGFNAQSSVLSEFVRLKPGDATTIQIDANGSVGGSSYTDLVSLTGAVGLDIAQMRQNGNLIV